MAAVNIVSIATLNRIRLYCGQPGTSEATHYTVPASTNTKISQIILCNTNSTPASISLSVVPSGDTAGPANRIISGLSVGGNTVTTFDLSVFMDTGDSISAVQVTSGAITVTISGEIYA